MHIADLTSIDDRLIATKRRAFIEDLTCIVKLNANELKAMIVEDFSTHEASAIESRFVSALNTPDLTRALRSGMIKVLDTPTSEDELADLRLMVFLKNWVGWQAFAQVVVNQDDGLNLIGFDISLNARPGSVSNPRYAVYGYAQAYHYCLLGYWFNYLRAQSILSDDDYRPDVRERLLARAHSYCLSLKLLVSAAPALFNLHDAGHFYILRMLEDSWNFDEHVPSAHCNISNMHCLVASGTNWLHTDVFCEAIAAIWGHTYHPEDAVFHTLKGNITHKGMQQLLDGLLKLLNFRGRSLAPDETK